MTHSIVRLINIDGERHDFVFATAEAAKRRYDEYIRVAEADKQDCADVVVTVSGVRVAARRIVQYKLRFLVAWECSAELLTDLGFEP